MPANVASYPPKGSNSEETCRDLLDFVIARQVLTMLALPSFYGDSGVFFLFFATITINSTNLAADN